MARGGLINFFKQYERCPGVGINWICFDGGGHETMPQSGYIIENYTRINKDINIWVNTHIKSVVKPQQVKFCPNPHYFFYKRFQKTVDENGKAVKGPWTKANTTRLIRINHYYTKSKEEYLKKIERNNEVWHYTFIEESWAFPEWKLDDSMKDAVAALRERGVPETYGSSADSRQLTDN